MASSGDRVAVRSDVLAAFQEPALVLEGGQVSGWPRSRKPRRRLKAAKLDMLRWSTVGAGNKARRRPHAHARQRSGGVFHRSPPRGQPRPARMKIGVGGGGAPRAGTHL